MVISPKLMVFILKGLFSDTKVYWSFEEQNIFGEIKQFGKISLWKRQKQKQKSKTKNKHTNK